MSQLASFAEARTTRARSAVGRAGFALPSWTISLLLHAALFACLATVSWKVQHVEPDREFSVGIVLKQETTDGPVFETQERTYAVSASSGVAVAGFEEGAGQAGVAELLPRLPVPDLGTLGLSGSMFSGAGELLAGPGAGASDPSSGWIGMTATQFFGAQVWGSKFVYVIDRSGSMSERDALGAAKRELLASLMKLPASAQFQIIFYNLKPEIMTAGGTAGRLSFATDFHKATARRHLDSIAPDGGTDHLPALKLALSLGPDVIFFLTDADDLSAREVQEITTLNSGRAKIHSIEFGIGPEISRPTTLRDLAQANGGTYRYVDTGRLSATRKGSDR